MNPWDRQPPESAKAYAAFRCYVEMGSDRSLAKVGERLGKSKALIERWSRQWEWVARVTAFDAHQHQLVEVARDQAAAEETQRWLERRKAQREREWNQAERLIQKAEAMLNFPLATTVSEDGKTIILPAKWQFGTAATLIDVASKLARLSAEMATDRQQHEHMGKDGEKLVIEVTYADD